MLPPVCRWPWLCVCARDDKPLKATDKTALHLGPRCCGSRLDVKQTIPSPRFRRFSSGGSFFVNYTVSRDVDMIPPNRIIDFRRVLQPSFDDRHQFVNFEWSAPGNDFVFGKAAEYRIECFGSTEEIAFDRKTMPKMPEPNVYGTRQTVTVKMPIVNQVVLCTIFAIDEVCNSNCIVLCCTVGLIFHFAHTKFS